MVVVTASVVLIAILYLTCLMVLFSGPSVGLLAMLYRYTRVLHDMMSMIDENYCVGEWAKYVVHSTYFTSLRINLFLRWVMVRQFLSIVIKIFFMSNPIVKINTLKYDNVKDVSVSVRPYLVYLC